MNVWISFSLVFGPKADERGENSNMLNGDMILFTVLYYCRALFLSQGIICMSIVRTLAETLNSKCFYLDVCCFVLYVTLSVQSYVLACSVWKVSFILSEPSVYYDWSRVHMWTAS